MLVTILLIIGLILIFLESIGVSHPRVNFGWLGLAIVLAVMNLPLG